MQSPKTYRLSFAYANPRHGDFFLSFLPFFHVLVIENVRSCWNVCFVAPSSPAQGVTSSHTRDLNCIFRAPDVDDEGKTAASTRLPLTTQLAYAKIHRSANAMCQLSAYRTVRLNLACYIRSKSKLLPQKNRSLPNIGLTGDLLLFCVPILSSSFRACLPQGINPCLSS